MSVHNIIVALQIKMNTCKYYKNYGKATLKL